MMAELAGKPFAFGQRNGYRTDHEQLFRYLPRLSEHYTVRSIVQTEGNAAFGPIYAVTLLARETPVSPMRAHLGFASAPCAGGDLALLDKPTPLDADDAVISWAEPLPALPAPHDAPLTEIRVMAGKGPHLDFMSHAPGDADTSFVVGAPRGKLTVSGGATFGVLGKIDGLRKDLAPDAPGQAAHEDAALLGSGWFPVDDGVAFLSVHHTIITARDEQCGPATKKDMEKLMSPPTLTLRARLDANGLAIDDDRVGVAYVVAIPENQPTQAIYGDSKHRCRSGPQPHTRGYEEAKAQWLYGLFGSKAAATSAATALGYKTGVVYAVPARGAQTPADAPTKIAASPPLPPGPFCARF